MIRSMSTPASRATVPEFTLKAVFTGVVLGIVFGAANAYLGLRVGMTVSASIPAAVMTVAAFRVFRADGTILEANLSQTIAAASTSLATGVIFTIPALFLWGMVPPYLQVVVLAFLGGVLGLSAMIPLRKLLIVDSHAELPYPEGTACAEVLRATTGDAASAGASHGVWIFRGMAVGAAVKLLLALFFLLPDELRLALPFLPRAELALEVAPALVGVGYILGYRTAAVCVSGALISSVTLTPLIAWLGAGLSAPLFPETERLLSEMTADDIWSRYVRYIGAGAVATAGIITVLRGLPTMWGAFAAVARGMKRSGSGADEGPVERTERDLPPWFVVGGIGLVVLVAGLVPGVFAGNMAPLQRAVLSAGVGVFGVLFVAVAARIVGIVGVSSQPTSGITLVTLLGTATVFAAAGWTDGAARAGVLTVGTIVAIAASKAGDISQDLKTGWLVGATPALQQVGQVIGAAFACWAVAATVLLLGNAYTFGSRELPAPQATLMKTVIEGVLAGDLPWGLVLTGGGLALGAILCGVSGLAFAIGVYLPLATMAPLYVGGCIRVLAERGAGERPAGESDPGILAASGLVAGEGLAGVLVAGLVAAGLAPKAMDPRLGGLPGEVVALLLAGAFCAFLYRGGRAGR
jgi:putative OPT family oligopeptide transporter